MYKILLDAFLVIVLTSKPYMLHKA